jgi:GNAT superfamily N-acetyltransferase
MLSLVEIARREERRQAVGTGEISVDSESVGGGVMSFTAVGSWSNQACGLGLDGPVSDDDLDRLVEFYASRGVEPRIEVAPFADESLIKGLSRRGFRLREFENVFAREIPPLDPHVDLRAALPHGWAKGLELVRVDPGDAEMVRTFIHASTVGFRDPDEPIADHFYDICRRMVEHERTSAYSAVIDGDVVGGCAMETTPDVCAFFGVSVIERFRRRGVQQAMIVRRLERAQELGCPLACIHSKPGIPTERNALRLGFTLAYTKAVMAMPGEGLEPSP